ncbi:MAG: DUF853 domain-containing protein, partial [Bacteroidales bacterium]|nr:DUF853 domain-containing protein [Bacteroidales bacterium]
IGEALVTGLNEKGIPTPLAATMLRAPMSRMDILTSSEIAAINRASELVRKYGQEIDRESAYEILGRKVTEMQREEAEEEARKEREKGRRGEWESPAPRQTYGRTARRGKSPQDQVVKVLTSATFIRGVFGILSKVMKK